MLVHYDVCDFEPTVSVFSVSSLSFQANVNSVVSHGSKKLPDGCSDVHHAAGEL